MKFKVTITDYTTDDFFQHVGRLPEDDDLERAMCSEAGTNSHKQCGVCIHMKPVFCCNECCSKAVLEPNFKRITDILEQKL